jgi:hypothetical protein
MVDALQAVLPAKEHMDLIEAPSQLRFYLVLRRKELLYAVPLARLRG